MSSLSVAGDTEERAGENHVRGVAYERRCGRHLAKQTTRLHSAGCWLGTEPRFSLRFAATG